LPRFPSAFRDIAVVVEEEVPAAEILRVIRQAGGDLLESTRLFDVYAGDPLPTGTKSIAVAMEFRAPGATLTQEEVSEVMDRIVSALGRELHATLRE
jgi:phenylalanyl-tRNA synthetase beta chain